MTANDLTTTSKRDALRYHHSGNVPAPRKVAIAACSGDESGIGSQVTSLTAPNFPLAGYTRGTAVNPATRKIAPIRSSTVIQRYNVRPRASSWIGSQVACLHGSPLSALKTASMQYHGFVNVPAERRAAKRPTPATWRRGQIATLGACASPGIAPQVTLCLPPTLLHIKLCHNLFRTMLWLTLLCRISFESRITRKIVLMSIEVLKNAPSFESSAILTINPLAPLSMVVQMPGKLYRTQAEPTQWMLYGLLENALGWHLGQEDRGRLTKAVMTRHRIETPATESGGRFLSLLQFHVRINALHEGSVSAMRYNDYWSQHLQTPGLEFVGGSREYDSRAIPLMDAKAKAEKDQDRITVDDSSKSRKDASALHNFQGGDKIHVNVLRPYFPRYYVTPAIREYIVPHIQYQYKVETSSQIFGLLSQKLKDPFAPLYLGSNDGWVDVEWQTTTEDVQ